MKKIKCDNSNCRKIIKRKYFDKRSKHYFCNLECAYEFRKGKNSHRYKKEAHKIYKCDNCGEKVDKYINYAKNLKHHFCNEECYLEFIHKNKKRSYCIECGKKCYFKSIRCNKCKGIPQRKPTRCVDCGKVISCGKILCWECYVKKCQIPENNPNWKDGRTPLRKLIRNLSKFDDWRIKVFERDNYTCQECFKRNKNLEVHHNKVSFSELLQEFLQEYDQFSPYEDKETLVRLAIKWKPFWDVDNGMTLCKKCHKLTFSINK